jgi:hypothetical protein
LRQVIRGLKAKYFIKDFTTLAFDRFSGCGMKLKPASATSGQPSHHPPPQPLLLGHPRKIPTPPTLSGQTSSLTTDSDQPVRFCSNNYSDFRLSPTEHNFVIDLVTD